MKFKDIKPGMIAYAAPDSSIMVPVFNLNHPNVDLSKRPSAWSNKTPVGWDYENIYLDSEYVDILAQGNALMCLDVDKVSRYSIWMVMGGVNTGKTFIVNYQFKDKIGTTSPITTGYSSNIYVNHSDFADHRAIVAENPYRSGGCACAA